jgi:AraC family transcriptional regulator of arabinose operon
VSISIKNPGAYDSPFSGSGVEFDPVWTHLPARGIVIHECGHLAANRHWNYPGVFSPFWRLYFNSDPGHHILFDSRAMELGPGRMALLPPHHRFHCRGVNRVSHLWIHFSFAKIPANASQAVFRISPTDTLLCLVRDLKALLGRNADRRRDRIHQAASALVLAALAGSGIRWRPPLPQKLEFLRQHIQANLLGDLRNASLAKTAGISGPTLGRIFKIFLGRGPAQYVAEIRVREAARLLRESTESIDSVAAQAGFPNRYYFSRVFKKMTGHPPAGFRSKYRADGPTG